MSLTVQNLSKYSYFMLGTRLEFPTMQAIKEYFLTRPYRLLEMPYKFGWWIVRRNNYTDRCIAFEIKVSDLQ